MSGCLSPKDLRPSKHEDVLDDLVEAGDEEVRPKGQAQCPEQGWLFCLLGGFHNQDFRLFHSLALFALTVREPLRGVQSLLLCPGKREWRERQNALNIMKKIYSGSGSPFMKAAIETLFLQ